MSGKEAAPLTAFVHSLDRTDRLVLMLHYAEELTPDEIGLVLDLPIDQIDTRIERLQCNARDFLQENLLSQPSSAVAQA